MLFKIFFCAWVLIGGFVKLGVYIMMKGFTFSWTDHFTKWNLNYWYVISTKHAEHKIFAFRTFYIECCFLTVCAAPWTTDSKALKICDQPAARPHQNYLFSIDVGTTRSTRICHKQKSDFWTLTFSCTLIIIFYSTNMIYDKN